MKTKLVIFDINHTLVKDSSWPALHRAMGMTDAEDQLLYSLNQEGVLTNDLWVQLVNAIYRHRGRPTRETVEAALLDYTYMDGARECVAALQSRGVSVALLSGAPDIFVHSVARDLGVTLWRAGAQLYFYADGRFSHFTYADEEVVKKTFDLESLCHEANVTYREVVCVADGSNDVAVFGLVRGVTFQGSKLSEKAWRVVNGLHDIPQLLR